MTTPSTTQKATPEADRFYSECQCTEHTYRLNLVNHDFLTGIEARGIAGAVDLFRWIELSVDEPRGDAGELMWIDLVEFVARHNWVNPGAMYDLAHFAVEYGHAMRNAGHGPRPIVD